MNRIVQTFQISDATLKNGNNKAQSNEVLKMILRAVEGKKYLWQIMLESVFSKWFKKN